MTMQFHFTPRAGSNSWATGFTLAGIWTQDFGPKRDISHLLDCTYLYHSARELQWHLADRFGLQADTVELTPVC
ncbi:hypothetical protein [Microvirga antarctica]|uniref:hypothetical protein n=1 Tax=Microvirga antarctica TaxID=2819233 RepID=UPI001B30FB40|nr:hypothetical protein [Microvirga antarctica]